MLSPKINLTIGIPTFNGSKYISEAIESVLKNIYPEIRGRVEILVSDNASNDDTSSIVHSLIKQYPKVISYYCNKTNIGFDANVQEIFKKARGEYVHILGDDDFIKINSLKRIFNVLDNNREIMVVLLEVSFLDINDKQEITGIKYHNDILCEDGDSFFRISKWGTSCISSIIVRKSAWLEQNLKKYYGSQWIHVGAILNILRKDGRAYIIADNLITVRINNPRWQENNGNQLYIGLKHLNIFSEMVELGYNHNIFKFYFNDRYYNNLIDILRLRAKCGSDNIPTAILMCRFFYKWPRFWFIDLPLLFLPYFLIERMRAIYRMARSIFSKLEVLLMEK